MKMNLKLPTTALLAGLLLLPAAGFAQAAPQSAASGHAGGAAANSSDAVEQHITQLHSQLKITAAEQPLWDQFAQVMRDNARDMHQAFEQRGTKLASLNAAENMQSYAQLAQQHAQDLQKLATAFQTLYAAMPDDQKAVADGVFRERPGHSAHPKA